MKLVMRAVAQPLASGPRTVTARVRAHLHPEAEVGDGEQYLTESVRRGRDVDDGRQQEVAVQNRLTDVDQIGVLLGDDLGEAGRDAGAVGAGDVKDDAVGVLVLAHARAYLASFPAG